MAEIKKVFLDTNVIISGLLTEDGYPRIILDLLSLNLPSLKGVTGEFNILELKRNIKKKFPALGKPFMEALDRLNLEIVRFPGVKEVGRLKEVIVFKDAPVLASAMGSGCAYLITGDKHFRTSKVKKATSPLKIVSPAEFVEKVLLEIIKP